MNRDPDLLAMFELFASAERGPVHTGYRPGHRLHQNYISSGEHRYVGCEVVTPGQVAEVEVRLLTPHLYPRCLWVGRIVDVQEGGRIVGRLRVVQVLNEVLCGDPATFQAHWVDPTGSS